MQFLTMCKITHSPTLPCSLAINTQPTKYSGCVMEIRLALYCSLLESPSFLTTLPHMSNSYYSTLVALYIYLICCCLQTCNSCMFIVSVDKVATSQIRTYIPPRIIYAIALPPSPTYLQSLIPLRFTVFEEECLFVYF